MPCTCDECDVVRVRLHPFDSYKRPHPLSESCKKVPHCFRRGAFPSWTLAYFSPAFLHLRPAAVPLTALCAQSQDGEEMARLEKSFPAMEARARQRKFNLDRGLGMGDDAADAEG